MQYEGLLMTDAMEVCSLARPAARPREIFLKDLVAFQAHLSAIDDELRWARAMAMAEEDNAVLAFTPSDVGSWSEVQAECQRWAKALQDHCVYGACGEMRQ